jgi:hypothetical protein
MERNEKPLAEVLRGAPHSVKSCSSSRSAR